MKKTLFFFLLSGIAQLVAQKPEKIYGNAREYRSLAYYKEQVIAWKREVDKNPKDANAWYNYYYATRNIMYNDTVVRYAKERSEAVNRLVEEMGKQIPDSYEYNLCKWQIGSHNQKDFPYLKRAAELGEGRTEHLDFMINQGELTRVIKDRETYSKRKFEAGMFSSGVIYYNYNVLMGLEKNAILLTAGDNDTYPIWYLQALGIRKDVTVINLSLIQLDYYRSAIFSELGIEKLQESFGPDMTSVDYQHYHETIVKHIAANKKSFPVYVALTTACYRKYINTIEGDLYLTGLAYLYSKESIDNMAILKNNVEHAFAFDYLDKPFYNEISPEIVKNINGNYIVPLLKLYDHYKMSGDLQKADWAKAKLLAISKDSELQAEVTKHLQAQ